jgi:hypothetical protein
MCMWRTWDTAHVLYMKCVASLWKPAARCDRARARGRGYDDCDCDRDYDDRDRDRP